MDINDPLVDGERKYLERTYGATHPEIVTRFNELIKQARENGGGEIKLYEMIEKATHAAFPPKPAPVLQQ